MKDALGLTLGALLDIPFDSRSPMQREAIAAAREALAQPEQEPVAFSCLRCATPKKCAVHGCSPNTWPSESSPKRPWVGLTDEEISQLWISTSPYFNEDDFARAVEAKLKELNT